MTGQELLKLQEANVFRSTVMDTIINEFVPSPDQFLLTDAFLPFKLVDKNVMIDLINNGAFGKTYPVNLGGEHRRISIPGYSYKEHTAGYWREAVQYDEVVLHKAVNPAQPLERYGEGLVTAALNFLDVRLNNMVEYVSSKVVISGSYSENRHGVAYTYDPKIPAKHFKNVTSSPGWTSGGTWATAANAKPTNDIIEASNVMRRMGVTPEKVLMSVKTLGLFHAATDTQNLMKASYVLVGRNADRPFLFNALTGMTVVVDNRLYAEETRLTADSAAADTTLDVEDATEFTTADVITLRNTSGEEEDATIDSISGNVITVTAGIAKSYKKGDRVTVYKQFLPDNYVLFQGNSNDRVSPNNWISTPSIVKGESWTNPLPGRYTWNYFKADKPPYFVEIGAGLDGGPKVSRCNWLTLKVIA